MSAAGPLEPRELSVSVGSLGTVLAVSVLPSNSLYGDWQDRGTCSGVCGPVSQAIDCM